MSFSCGICEISDFPNIDILSQHILESHHTEDECLECPDCGAIFDSVSSFSDHFTKHEATRVAATSDADAPEVLFLCDSPALEPESPSRNDDNDEFVDMASTIELEAHVLDWQKRDNKERPFACDICDRTFTLASSLALHVRRHLDIKHYECSECGKKFVQSSDLDKHRLTHSDKKSFICNYCGLTFTQYRNLKNHMKMHTEAPVVCKYCGKTFRIDTSLRHHLKKHEGPAVQLCTIDGIPFTSARDLAAHVKKAHSNGWPCDVCLKTFGRSCDLIKHRRIHSGEKLFSCKICEKSFTHQTSLRNHLTTHTGLKPFQCSYCGQSFSFSGNLKTHIRTHTNEKPFPCKICGKSFGRSANLNEHLKVHTGEKSHKCGVCGKSFSTSSTFSKHKKIHTGERPHQCQICDKRFIQLAHLKKHGRIHTGEKPFGCTQCNKYFRRSDTLASHLKTHNKVPKKVDEEITEPAVAKFSVTALSVPQPTELFQVHLAPELLSTDDLKLNGTSALVQQPGDGSCQQLIQITWT